MGWLIAVGLLSLVLLWVATQIRRRSIRALLLASGAQTSGTSSRYQRGRRSARIAVRYLDNTGTQRVAVKSLVSAGDAELLKKPAVVLYHPRRADRADYVLLGFGHQPGRWFPVEFVKNPDRGD